MFEITMGFKSGKEYHFKCEEYKLEKNLWGDLINFSYENGSGECPIFYRADDIESIAVAIAKE